jgi:hypothetical protein
MQFFRSTILKGGSWHAWPDDKGHILWSLPQAGQPGDWREALAAPTIPHGNGLHAARWRALAYWVGPLNFKMDIDEERQQPMDHSLEENSEDIVVCRRARLAKELPVSLEQWQDISIQCADLLSDFPTYYNYKGRYDARAYEESIDSPGEVPQFRNGKIKYEWSDAIQKTAHFFEKLRAEENYAPGMIEQNISALGSKYKKNATAICKHLDQIELQKYAHLQSYARCEEYNHHTQAMTHAMTAIATLKEWVSPWAEPKDIPETSQDAIASLGHGVIKTIVQNIHAAYYATGAEQHRLMMTNKQYTMATGVGPLLQDLPLVNEKHLNTTSPGDLAGRGVMLKMGEFFAKTFDVLPLYQQDMAMARPLGPVISKIIEHQHGFSID